MGEVAAAQTPPLVDEAEAAYREALKMAQGMGMRPLEARCRLGLAALYQQAARAEEARAEVAAAVEGFHALGMQAWLARAESASAGGG
jgi:hypothetical protein